VRSTDVQTTRQTVTLPPLRDMAAGRGAGEWLASLAVLLLRALAVLVLASPLVLAAAWLLG
jgi:hypothetical protein